TVNPKARHPIQTTKSRSHRRHPCPGSGRTPAGGARRAISGAMVASRRSVLLTAPPKGLPSARSNADQPAHDCGTDAKDALKTHSTTRLARSFSIAITATVLAPSRHARPQKHVLEKPANFSQFTGRSPIKATKGRHAIDASVWQDSSDPTRHKLSNRS